MFVCKPCLAEHYASPKWEDVFNRSVGPCDRCGRNDVCARVQTLILKEPQILWQCTAAQRPSFFGGPCSCDPIKPGDEVIEISRDLMGGIRCVLTTPNPHAAHPEYAASPRCAGEAVMSHLRAQAMQPKTVPWPHPQGKPYVPHCRCGTYPECRP